MKEIKLKDLKKLPTFFNVRLMHDQADILVEKLARGMFSGGFTISSEEGSIEFNIIAFVSPKGGAKKYMLWH